MLVTVILPVRNEESSIGATLDSILAQDYQGGMEILVADGRSDDRTRKIIADYQARHRRVHLIDNPGRIVPTGINAALRVAKGEVIIRVDGHTTIARDYVRECLHALERSGADNVGGRMTAQGGNAFGKSVAAATSSPFGVGGARFHYSEEEEWVDTVYLGAWPRVVFEKIGLFDEELVRDQDDEFNYRLRSHGGRILLSPKIRSQYINRSSLKDLWKQYFQYGFYKVRVMQKHPKQMRPRQLIPGLFVATLVGSAALGLVSAWGQLTLGGVMAAYLAANLTATAVTAWRRGWQHLAHLPITFGILHLSYGSGFLAGLLHFRKRWGDQVGKTPLLVGRQ